MNYLEAFYLALIQGLTEFLPISSSAHLILLSEYLGSNQNLFYDISLHLGTLFAVCIYFKNDLKQMLYSFVKDSSSANNQLLVQLVISSLPTLILGFILVDLIDSHLRTSSIIVITTILFGVVLFIATFKKPEKLNMNDITLQDAFIIGLAQSLSLIPGTSRSGITISTGLFLGLDNKTASKFSFLMAIPTIGAIAGYQLFSVDLNYLIKYSQMNILGVFVSFIVAYITIDFFIKFINKIGFLPFIIYRIALGLVLFLVII